MDYGLIIKVEHPLHHLPLLIARGIGVAALELADEGFPFRLSGQGGEPRHCFVPVEVGRSIHYHYQQIAQDIDFHLKDANLSDAVANLFPTIFGRVPLDVLTPCLFVGAERKRLHKALRLALILLLYVAVHHINNCGPHQPPRGEALVTHPRGRWRGAIDEFVTAGMGT